MSNSGIIRRSTLAVALVATGLISTSLASVSSARGVRPATYSGTNGPLVYEAVTGSGPSLRVGVYASSPSGTETSISLTKISGLDFSADGSKIVWTEVSGPTWSIKVANANGTNSATVISGSTSPSAGGNPTFSPNGNLIAFDYGNDIYTIGATESGKAIADATRITTSSGMGMGARTPKYLSSTKIAYIGGQPTNSCSSSAYNGIYVKDTTVAGNGSLLTNSCDSGMNRTYAISMDVSPDGNWIVYKGLATYGFIALIKADNTGSRVSVYSATSYSNEPQGRPFFSPDGTKIVYDNSTAHSVVSFDGTTVGSPTPITLPTGVRSPANMVWAPASAVLSATSAATTTVAPTTTTAATTTAPATTTTVPKNVYATAIPGVTVTDTKVYTAAPAKVAAASAIDVMTPAEAKTSDIVSRTPSVCLPNDEDLVFIDDGKCIAQVVNEKTRKVLRTLRTTVVPDDISEIKVGNEIAVLSPLYFTAGTATMKASSVRRLNTMTTQVKAAGSILVAGHSGVLMGDTPENRALSRQRAAAVVSALKKRGATADFAIAAVGALDPVSTGDSRADQDKNRRAVVVLIP